MNDRFCEIVGYSKTELIGQNSKIIYTSEEEYEYVGSEKYRMIKETGTGTLETHFRRKNGEIINVLLSSTPIDLTDLSAGVTFTALDITESKRVLKELKKSEELYRALINNIQAAVVVHGTDTSVTHCNPKALELLGLKQNQIIGRMASDPKWHFLNSNGNKTPFEQYPVNQVIATKQNIWNQTIGIFLPGKDDFVWILVSANPVFDGKGEIQQVIVTFMDITELRKEDIPNWNPVHTNLEEIKSASLRAANIVKQLLNFSRKTDQEIEPIGAVTVIKDALKLLKSTIPSTIEFRGQLPDAEMPIMGNPTQINQVMMNLCSNASQAMEETGGILEINVEESILKTRTTGNYFDLPAGDYLKITLSDTGPGISSEIINRIFDPYFTTKEMGKGSGMGLSIVHGIVKNHNGAITVDSKIDKGTTFTILFPVIHEKSVDDIKTSGEKLLGTESILFIDDEESITNMIEQVLERLGYRVETSLNPVEALELFKSKPEYFDLVITDMTMPQMTGAKLSEKLIEIRSNIPIIICTGHSSLIDEEKAKQIGIAGYVMKPASMSIIAKAIRKVLDK